MNPGHINLELFFLTNFNIILLSRLGLSGLFRYFQVFRVEYFTVILALFDLKTFLNTK